MAEPGLAGPGPRRSAPPHQGLFVAAIFVRIRARGRCFRCKMVADFGAHLCHPCLEDVPARVADAPKTSGRVRPDIDGHKFDWSQKQMPEASMPSSTEFGIEVWRHRHQSSSVLVVFADLGLNSVDVSPKSGRSRPKRTPTWWTPARSLAESGPPSVELGQRR